MDDTKEEFLGKWYLKTWFICLLFAFWGLVIPPIVGIILLIMQSKEISKVNKTFANIEELLASKNLEAQKIVADATLVADTKKSEVEILDKKIINLRKENEDLIASIEKLKQEIFIQAVNISQYEGITSDECKNELGILNLKQNELIKSGKCFNVTNLVGNAPKKTIENNKKQLLRCFNAESLSIIENITFKNSDTARSKLTKSFETLNSIFSTDGISLTYELLELKYKELSLVYAHMVKKEEERETQKAIREQLVEEEKVRREIEKEKLKIEKEESQFKNEVTKLMAYLQKTENDIEKQLYADKIKELEEKLKLLEKDKENVLDREQNTRAGFVYVISNIGSFGENIYKIGMTRRLEPMDRINELGDASVPFKFDVHAIIFSEDAPGLENVLHQTFREHEVNKVNPRKEFFKIDLAKIEEIVKANHNATVEFISIPEAVEYRESLQLDKNKTA